MKNSVKLDRKISCTFYENVGRRRYTEKIAPSLMGDGFRILFRHTDDPNSDWNMYGVGDLRLEYDTFEKAEAVWYRSLLRRIGAKTISDLQWEYLVNGQKGLF